MQNPFVHLQKYQPNLIDPQENRATEALAACLAFSVPIRRLFLDFLFEHQPPAEDGNSFQIYTQYPTDDGNWIDLLIEKEGVVTVALEIKVKQGEDGTQIRKYSDWLHRTKKGKSYVFHLVKHHDSTFDIRKHGGTRHHTWKALYDCLREFWRKTERGTTDANLAEQLCGYLEKEGIVNTWESIFAFFVVCLASPVLAQYGYTISGGKITITGYDGPGGAISIPPSINGFPVTSIGNDAFRYCTNLTSITIATTAQGVAAGAVGLPGLNTSSVDTRYVKKAGDTMSGPLTLPADGLQAGGNQLVLSGDNVGIGTYAPTNTLDVNGGVLARGGPPGGLGQNHNGYAFSSPGDNDSGMFSSADGQLEFYANAREQVRLNRDGRVGIGTAYPEAQLDVKGNPRVDNTEPAQLRLTGGAGEGARSLLDLATYPPGTNAPTARIQATDIRYSADVDILTKEPGADTNALVSRLHIAAGGNVGIGTTNPQTALHVVGSIIPTASPGRAAG